MQDTKESPKLKEVCGENEAPQTIKHMIALLWRETKKHARENFVKWRGRMYGAITTDIGGKSVISYLAFARLFGCLLLCFFAGLAQLSEGVYPVGLAFCASFGKQARVDQMSGKRIRTFSTAVAMAGVFLSFFFLEKVTWVYLSFALSLICIRGFLTSWRFDEPQFNRIGLAGVLGLSVSLASVFLLGSERFLWSDIILMTLATPLFAYLCSSIYTDTFLCPEGNHHFLPERMGESALLFACVHTLSDVLIGGVSIGFSAAALLTLAAARTRGPVAGGLCGMFIGFASGGLYGLGSSCGVLGCSGFFAGLFFSNSLIGVAVFFLVSFGAAVISYDPAVFWNVLTDILLGIAVFYPLLPLLPENKRGPEQIGRFALREDGMRAEWVKNKIDALSRAFLSLSISFSDVSEGLKKPRITEIKEMTASVCKNACEHCASAVTCWGKTYMQSDEVLSFLSLRLSEVDKIREDDVPARFRSQCRRLSQVVERLNERYRNMRRRRNADDATGLLSAEYSALAGLLHETADGLEENVGKNPHAVACAERALEELSLDRKNFSVYGKRSPVIDVFGITPENAGFTAHEAAQAFSRAFGCPFASPAFVYREGRSMMRMKKKRRLSLECAKKSRAKRGETQNGDTVSFFENEDECFFALLCDGMGSGRDAALTSRLSGLMVERLMRCVSTKHAPLEMLNHVLLSKPDESFATVDLLEIDLLEGVATFIKAGAAPSFVVREENLYKISSKTPPAGTWKVMRAEQTTMELFDGDVIVMISDGLIENGEAPDKLLRTLAFDMQPRPADMAEKLIFESADFTKGASDDMTAVVIRVKEEK